jgi:dihydrolipoamide dehydrogenase
MQSFDLTVIGAGPGGYVAAIRAAQLGMRVGIIERDRLGGVCLNWGCIPTKALLRTAEQYEFLKASAGPWGLKADGLGFDWPRVIARSREAADRLSRGVASLMKKNKISVVTGEARFLAPGRIEVRAEGKSSEVSTRHAIIATGARPATIPGVTPDGKRVITSKEAMVLPEAPRSMTIIGAGAIGLEFAYFYAAFGTDVTIIEYFDRILPGGDEEISAQLARSFKKKGMKIHASSRVKESAPLPGGAGTRTTFEKDGKAQAVESDVTLVAVGVRGNVEGLGLEEIGVAVEKGFIKVDDDLRTGVQGTYAIGDVCGPPALAHVASAEGIHAVEHSAGRAPRPLDYSSIPACIYCHPQVASVGCTEAEAREKGHDVAVGKFPFAANGKSVAVGETEGFVKIIGDKRYGEILGAHIIGAEATDLIAEIALAKAAELTVDDIHHTVHAHPTLSESVMEAAADWRGEAIQM